MQKAQNTAEIRTPHNLRNGFWIALGVLFLCLSLLAAPARASSEDETIPTPASIENGTIPDESGTGYRIIITEFMADNASTLFDEDGDASDWIELFNADDRPVDLAGYALTDSADDLRKWIFPSYALQPGEYLLVFASDKNRTDPTGPLHTNFALQRAGEYLALVDPDGNVVDSYAPSYPPQYADIVYGLDATGLRRYLSTATPGTSNDVPANAGPVIVGTINRPTIPYPGSELRVLSVVRPGQGAIFSVELRYRVMFGAERTLEMGLESVDSSGNLIYSAVIPPADFHTGEMVRYYTVAFDTQGRYTRWPLVGNPQDSPYYFGTVIGDPEIGDEVPTLHWFVKDPDAAETREGTRASVFFQGRFYDNVFVRTRGVSAATRPKKSFKFEFNDGYEFRIPALNVVVDEINVNTNLDDTSYMRQILAWEAFRATGSPYSFAFPLRVERNGHFYGLYTVIEQPDSDYFVRNNLDYEGALYKVDSNTLSGNTGGLEKRTRKDEDFSDIIALMNGLSLDGDAREAFLFDNINLPAVLNFLAVSHVIQDWDYVSHNHYLYRDTRDTGEWMFLPWDKDLTFGTVAENGINNHPFHGSEAYPAYFVDTGRTAYNHLIDALFDTPRIRDMYLRRLRTVSDLLLKQPGTPAEERFFEPRMDQLSAQLADVAALDELRWSSRAEFAGAVEWIKVHSLDVKRRQLYESLSVTAGGIFPEGPSGAPLIYFQNVDTVVPGQPPRSEYFVLRNHGSDALDISGWSIKGAVEHTFQPGTVIAAGDALFVTKDAHAFRSRTVSPRGGESHFIQEGYKGMMDDAGGTLWLYDNNGQVVDSTTFGPALLNEREVFLPIVMR